MATSSCTSGASVSFAHCLTRWRRVASPSGTAHEAHAAHPRRRPAAAAWSVVTTVTAVTAVTGDTGDTGVTGRKDGRSIMAILGAICKTQSENPCNNQDCRDLAELSKSKMSVTSALVL